MESDKRPPKTNDSRNPLNVAAEKIEETRARVHGDGSKSLKDFPVPPGIFGGTSGEINETARTLGKTGGVKDFYVNSEDGREGSSGNAAPEMSEDDLISSCTIGDSESAQLGLSEDEKWSRKHFKRPLTLAMRDIVAKRPSDPVNYLASWLLNYRTVLERSRLRDERDRELAEERRRIHAGYSELFPKSEELEDSLSDTERFEGDEQIADSNFQNYEISRELG